MTSFPLDPEEELVTSMMVDEPQVFEELPLTQATEGSPASSNLMR